MNIKFTILSLFLSIGLFAQTQDSLRVTNKFGAERPVYTPKAIVLPLAFMAAGVAINGNQTHSVKNQVKNWRNDNMPNFRTHIDDVLQFVPFASVYGLEMMGMKAENDWKNQTAIMVKSHIINLGLLYILKKSINDTRPDNSGLSFPSGHTAEAFAGATMVSMEYGKKYKWVPYAAYGTASAVGALRIANNKHYLSDVLFGAGLGILSTKVAYWTHQYKWNKSKQNLSWTDPLDGKVYNK